MLRWFVGLGPKPGFERWAYWEKFDFWGAAADIVIIGFTGLVLWFPNFFCRFLPGKVLNIAQVIHSTQALLATGSSSPFTSSTRTCGRTSSPPTCR